MGVPSGVCAVAVCVCECGFCCGRGIEGLCFDSSVVGVRWACPLSCVTFEPCHFCGHVMGSKVRPWQLMRQSTPLVLCGRYSERKDYEGVKWV